MRFKIKILLAVLNLRWNRWFYRSDLGKLRAKRWAKFSQKLIDSPFYSQFVKSSLPHSNYPLMNKAEFMHHFNAINTTGIKQEEAFEVASRAEATRDFAPLINDHTVGLSTGTSGNRGIFIASDKERAQWVAAILDRVIGLSFRKRSVAFFLRANSNLYSAVKSRLLRFEFFDLLESLRGQVPRLNALDPTILVGQPSLLLELAHIKEKGELTISPSKVIAVAEVLYPEDNAYLQRVFGQTIHQVYQATEGFLAATCEHGTLHFNDDFLIIEKQYIDKSKTRFHPVITDLLRTSQPIIRYELNDIIHEKLDCPCGSLSMGIEAIEGRSDDVLCFEDESNNTIKIFPDFIRSAVVMSDGLVQNYGVAQSGKNELQLYVEGSDASFEKAKNSLASLLAEKGITKTDIHRVEHLNNPKGQKLRRVRNDHWKAN
jgi:putative adenylate-forming enzyme